MNQSRTGQESVDGTERSLRAEAMSNMSEPANPSLTTKQRIFVVVLLLFGTLLAIGVARFPDSQNSSGQRSGHPVAASSHTSPQSERP